MTKEQRKRDELIDAQTTLLSRFETRSQRVLETDEPVTEIELKKILKESIEDWTKVAANHTTLSNEINRNFVATSIYCTESIMERLYGCLVIIGIKCLELIPEDVPEFMTVIVRQAREKQQEQKDAEEKTIEETSKIPSDEDQDLLGAIGGKKDNDTFDRSAIFYINGSSSESQPGNFASPIDQIATSRSTIAGFNPQFQFRREPPELIDPNFILQTSAYAPQGLSQAPQNTGTRPKNTEGGLSSSTLPSEF